jgi:hypothetical protein
VGVQEVRWDEGHTVTARDCNFLLWKIKRKSSIVNRVLHHTIVSAVMMGEGRGV